MGRRRRRHRHHLNNLAHHLPDRGIRPFQVRFRGTMYVKLPSWLISWKTTLGGVFVWILNGVQTYQALHAGQTLQYILESPQFWLFMAAGAGLIVAKDGQVTGGSIGQPSTLPALQASNVAPSTTHAPGTIPSDPPKS
jgi:hypothetical protein